MAISDQEHLIEVTDRTAEALEILARALHVKNAELQPTLEAIASTAVTMLSPARYAGLTILSRGELKVDLEKYASYRSKYIKAEGSPESPLWTIVIDHVER